MKRGFGDVFLYLLAIFAPVVCIHSMFSDPAYTESLKMWNAGDLLAYFGTMSLSVVALIQNDKITKIEKQMLGLEENKRIPSVVLFSLRREELKICDINHTLLSYMEGDDKRLILKENGDIDSNCPEVYLFRLKNVTDADIIGIRPDKIYVSFYDEIRGFAKRKKLPWVMRLTNRSIQGRDSIPFLLGVPGLWAEQQRRNGNHFLLSFEFFIQSADGISYYQSIDLSVASTTSGPIITPIIRDQIVGKPKRDEREIENG